MGSSYTAAMAQNDLLTLLVEDNAILSGLKWHCLLPAELIDRF